MPTDTPVAPRRETKASIKEAQRQEQLEGLRELIKPGDTVYTILRHVSTSGMSRVIDVVFIKNDQPMNITYAASVIMDYKRHNKHNGGLVVGGCGMDMGYHVVYSLSRYLFPFGFKVEGAGRNGDTSGHDNDGGYALKHRWL